MNIPGIKSAGLRQLTALVLFLSVSTSSSFLRPALSVPRTQIQKQGAGEQLLGDTVLYSVEAIASSQGVLLRWKTSFELDNVGFNIFRERGGTRVQVNREIIPGSAFIVGQNVPLRAGYSYAWFDAEGTKDSLYSIEALSLNGSTKSFGRILPTWQDKIRSDVALIDSNKASLAASSPAAQTSYPAMPAPVITEGALEDQWAIAAQPGLKIAIKREGWYRVTQQQMVAAGFSPVTDIANLRLFLGARELAIRTSRTNGQFVTSDFIEFYGQGVDTATTDSNIYYLIAGSTPGKRIPGGAKRTRGDIHSESESTAPVVNIALPSIQVNPQTWFWWVSVPDSTGDNISTPERVEPIKKERNPTREETSPAVSPVESSAPEVEQTRPDVSRAKTLPQKPATSISQSTAEQPLTPAEVNAKKKGKRKQRRTGRVLKQKFAHAVVAPPVGGNAVTFPNTVQRKDRTVYFVSLINGDTENYFGAVLSTLPVDQTLTISNPATSSGETAQLEIALQGANFTSHTVNVQFNGLDIGAILFASTENKIQTFNIPAAQLLSGINTVRLISQAGSGLSLVDHIRLTYPHTYVADGGSLRFSLQASQSARIDGFTTASIRVIDYTDPFAVKIIKPLVEANGASYTVQVPSASTDRLLYAIPDGAADQPALISLNQPSTLNAAANDADLIVISHSSLIPALAPLTTLRTSQGLSVRVVDVEDVFDEFSFGAHGPQAIRDFLSWAAAHWTRVPRYIILAGDASSDPRNYLGFGNFDLVPTKLVDATFSETASDDWLCDFDNDGAADIPIGRLPVRTPAEASLVVSKIINFLPSNTPQSALLVADTQGSYYFNFEQANSQVQSLLPAGMTVQRVDRRLESSDAQARADIIASFNSGQALVNYSGHGNVDTWTGGQIFTTPDATNLTNGNRLPFVVVMDCLNGYFQDPQIQGIAEALIKAPAGGAVAAFASSGSTIPDGQHAMSTSLYTTLYGSQPIALGDAIKIAKAATFDIDVRRTWIFFGDPSMRIR